MQVADFPLKNLDLVELELRQIHERSLPSGAQAAKRGSFSEILAIFVVLWGNRKPRKRIKHVAINMDICNNQLVFVGGYLRLPVK